MNITELINNLTEIKEKHGDIAVLLADKYEHYEIKWVDFSEVGGEEHACIRMDVGGA